MLTVAPYINKPINIISHKPIYTTGVPIPFNIEQFKARIDKNNGLAPSNLFHVRFGAPWLSQTGIDVQDLEFYCQSTSVPGMGILTGECRHFGYGPLSPEPLTVIYEELQTQFMLDNKGNIEKFFRVWLNRIVSSNYTPPAAPTTHNATGLAIYQVGYPEDFEAQVFITMFDQTGTKTHETTLHAAWPKYIGQVALSWANQDQIAMLPVTLVYWSHTTNSIAGETGGTSGH